MKEWIGGILIVAGAYLTARASSQPAVPA